MKRVKVSKHTERKAVIQTIKARAANATLRALQKGMVVIRMDFEEADELGEEAAAWCRAKGLRWVEVDGGIEVGL